MDALAIETPIGSLLERALAHPPHWANDVILAWDEAEFHRLQPFVERSYWTDAGSVNVFRVVGTQHWDYQGMTWLRFLEAGKRMAINLGLHARHPEYYQHTTRKKPMMYYQTLDGLNYFVGSDGNHRTGIARFDFQERGLTTIHGVTIHDHRVDHEMRSLYEALTGVCADRRIPARIEPASEGVRREDGPGWKLDVFRVALRFEEGRQHPMVLDRAGAEAKLRELTAPARRRWFGWAGLGGTR